MSRQSLPLPDFLATLLPTSTFPKQPLTEYLAKTNPSKNECLSALKENILRYTRDYMAYRYAATALWICAVRNYPEGIEQGLQFLQGLMRSRLLLLVFDAEGQFTLHEVLQFIEEPLEAILRKALELGWAGKLMEVLKRSNRTGSRINQVLFLLELLMIKKIRKQLDHSSLNEFMHFLRGIVSPGKIDRIQLKNDTLKFKTTALLRMQDESSETFQLQLAQRRLNKVPQPSHLPPWVLQAYSRVPPPIDMKLFRARKVWQIYVFLCQAEVYASSTFIEQFDCQVEGYEGFMEIFQRFLLGNRMGEGEYRFGSEGAREAVRQLRDRVQQESQCYRSAIMAETVCLIGDPRSP